MGTLTVRLPDDVHAKWKAYCASLDLKPSTAVRQAIEQQLNITPNVPAEAPAVKAGGQNKVRVSVWLTESEREGIRLRTTLHGGTRAGWIIKVIRSALTQAPVLGAEQTEAVQASNYQLLKIGTNINQIARRLNEHQDSQAKAVELAELQAIRGQIDAHVSSVEKMIATVTERGVLL